MPEKKISVDLDTGADNAITLKENKLFAPKAEGANLIAGKPVAADAPEHGATLFYNATRGEWVASTASPRVVKEDTQLTQRDRLSGVFVTSHNLSSQHITLTIPSFAEHPLPNHPVVLVCNTGAGALSIALEKGVLLQILQRASEDHNRPHKERGRPIDAKGATFEAGAYGWLVEPNQDNWRLFGVGITPIT